MTENTENTMDDVFYAQLEEDAERQQFTPPVALTKENILENAAVFDPLYQFDTEPDMTKYICTLRQTAKELRIAGEFDKLAQAHKKAALKLLKERRAEEIRAELAARRAARNAPAWIQYNHFDEPYVNEPEFLRWFTSEAELKCINGRFYSIDGQIPENEIKSRIQNAISPYLCKGVAKITENLCKGLMNYCYSEQLKARQDEIHVRNGVLFTNGEFISERRFCVNRLSVDFEPEAPPPEKFLCYLNQLLYEEDVPTLQEFMGYCLIPSTKAQVMLFLIGSGGEGKGVLGDILAAMFRNNLTTGKVQNLATDKFMLGDLVDKLLFLDDDINFEGIRDTGLLKSIVTASAPLAVEHKHQSRYDVRIFARILCFGNNCLNSLYDHTDGFYRRQVIIRTKNKAEDRKDNPHLAAEIVKTELNSVFLWAFQGLQRLIQNQFQITISERAKAALQQSKDDNFNLTLFLQDETIFGTDYEITTADFYRNYEDWCRINGFTPFKRDTITRYLKNNAEKLGVVYSENCAGYDSRRARGFRGMKTRKKCVYTLQGV